MVYRISNDMVDNARSSSDHLSNDHAIRWCQAYENRLSSSYATMELQEELFRDRLFKDFFYKVVTQNKHLFKDKIVLEVDCGLGVLSTAVSRYAKKVIAIEASYLADLLTKIVAANKIDNLLVIRDHVENVHSLPEGIEGVDILMSQYMGYLFYDKQLLARLVNARDKFLKPDGIMLPDCIQVFIAGIDYGDTARIQWLATVKQSPTSSEPRRETVSERIIRTDGYRLRLVNLRTLRIDNYNFTNKFHLNVNQCCVLNAIVIFFEIVFTKCHKKVILSTAPEMKSTRWKQMVLHLEKHILCEKNSTVFGEFFFRESLNKTSSPIHFEVRIRSVRSLADFERIRQRKEAKQRPLNRIISHASQGIKNDGGSIKTS